MLGGVGLNDIEGPVYDRELEAALVHTSGEFCVPHQQDCARCAKPLPAPAPAAAAGSAVKNKEMVWVRRADGKWVLLQAELTTGNGAALAVSAQLAQELGYCDQVHVLVTQSCALQTCLRET